METKKISHVYQEKLLFCRIPGEEMDEFKLSPTSKVTVFRGVFPTGPQIVRKSVPKFVFSFLFPPLMIQEGASKSVNLQIKNKWPDLLYCV